MSGTAATLLPLPSSKGPQTPPSALSDAGHSHDKSQQQQHHHHHHCHHLWQSSTSSTASSVLSTIDVSSLAPSSSSTTGTSASDNATKAVLESANKSMVEASRRGSVGVLRACLEYGCSPNHQCLDYGWTPLMHAAREGWLHCVKLLLQSGADPNLRDRMGQTALHRASFRGHYEIVRELLHAGADPTMEDFMNQTAQHLAVQEAHWKVQRKLDRAELRWHRRLEKEARHDAKTRQKQLAKLKQRRADLEQERREVRRLEQRTLALRKVGPFVVSSSAKPVSPSQPFAGASSSPSQIAIQAMSTGSPQAVRRSRASLFSMGITVTELSTPPTVAVAAVLESETEEWTVL